MVACTGSGGGESGWILDVTKVEPTGSSGITDVR